MLLSQSQRNRRQCRLGVESLEDRTTPTVSTITSAFNGIAVDPGSTVWFNCAARVIGLQSTTTLHVTDATVSFTANGSPYTVDLPDTTVTFSSLVVKASTSYSAAGGWSVTAPLNMSNDNVFFGGAGLPVPGGLPGMIQGVTWTGNFTADATGLTVNWKWAAAAYSSFGSDPASLGIKSVDGPLLDAVYANADKAGTPEAFKQFLVGGARGGGGANYTGAFGMTTSVVPGQTPPPPSGASFSGTVFLDTNLEDPHEIDGIGDVGFGGITVNLLDITGTNIIATEFTAEDGTFTFTNISPGTYCVQMVAPTGTNQMFPVVGTSSVGTTYDGDVDTSLTGFTGIELAAGETATGYLMGFYPTDT
jgi:hypothetical protein